jgi:hypothetical protein
MSVRIDKHYLIAIFADAFTRAWDPSGFPPLLHHIYLDFCESALVQFAFNSFCTLREPFNFVLLESGECITLLRYQENVCLKYGVNLVKLAELAVEFSKNIPFSPHVQDLLPTRKRDGLFPSSLRRDDPRNQSTREGTKQHNY